MRRAAVIWDMDGVIVDSERFHYEAWWWLAEQRGAGLTREEFLDTFGMANPEVVARLFGAVAELEAQEIASAKEREFRRRLAGCIAALPGADRLIRSLHAEGHAQAVASSAPVENIEVILRELGLGECFRAIASGDDVSRGKPDPEIFTLAARRLGAAPADCIVIEDAVVGVRAGSRAGMTVYAVTTTRLRHELEHADRVVDSLEELAPADFLLP